MTTNAITTEPGPPKTSPIANQYFTPTKTTAPDNPIDGSVDILLTSLPEEANGLEEGETLIPSYWDATTASSNMLSPRSVEALSRLRSFVAPPFPLWDTLPTSRRAAVLILLFADRGGELRVVLTMRSTHLRSFAGHAAFPGGKADGLHESEFEIARREAWEEVGLPSTEDGLPDGFHIEELCVLPFNLAKTELVVRPCVAFLHAPERREVVGGRPGLGDRNGDGKTLLPKLDAKEVAAVFSAPFYNFLLTEDEQLGGEKTKSGLPPGIWYEGGWTSWHGEPWRMHFFYVPVTNQKVTKPSSDGSSEIVSVKPGQSLNATDAGGSATPTQRRPAMPNGSASADPAEESRKANKLHVAESATHAGRYKVWGMTARMVVDAATVAYGQKPEFPHSEHFGDEKMIVGLEELGRLGEVKAVGTGSGLTDGALEREKGKGRGEKGRI